MESHFFCLICQNTVNGSLAYQMPTCPCILCTHCARGGVEGQLLPVVQALVNSEEAAVPEIGDRKSSGGAPDAFSRVSGGSTPEGKSSAKIMLECPACAEAIPVTSVYELIHESLEIWQALSPDSLLREFPPLERFSLDSRGEPEELWQDRQKDSRTSFSDEEQLKGLVACLMCKEDLCGDVLFRIPSCGCPFCLPCVQPLLHSQLEEKIMRCSVQGDKECLDCPNCSIPVPVGLLKDILPDSVQRWEEDKQSAELITQQRLQACPSCGLLALRVPSSAVKGRASIETDDRGKPLSFAAIRHRDTNRFRCPQCEANYCGCCNAVPYHMGRTCEEHELFLRSPPCRFCGEIILKGGSNDLAEVRKENQSRNSVASRVVSGAMSILRRSPRTPVKDGAEDQSTMARVCNDENCQEKAKLSCTLTHRPCGHPCGGIRDERQCLPCMEEECKATNQGIAAAGDLCPICMAESLGSAPAILLQCRHVVHASCALEMVERGFPGPEISFRFLECPACHQEMKHHYLKSAMQQCLILKAKVETLIENKVRALGKKFESKEDESKERLAVEKRCLLFRCDKCQEPFHGGDRDCGIAGDEPNGGGAGEKEVRICERCGYNTWSGEKLCKNGHGDQYIQYKCRYCCAAASWFCFGTTHFCKDCHNARPDANVSKERPKCRGGPDCPLQVAAHPPAGEEFILGCGLCRTSNIAEG